MALIASLESDLRMLAAEARRKFPAIKDAADRSIFKVRLASTAGELAWSDDAVKTFLLACESRNNKLSIMGLAGVDKLIAHDAVAPSVLPSILATLKDRLDMPDEFVQLKTLQLSLTILQSQLYPKDENQMAIVLGICLRLLGNSRNSDSVHSTAVATVRQAVALIFDSVLRAENLPVLHYGGIGGWSLSSNFVAGEVSRSIITSELAEGVYVDNQPPLATENQTLSEAGRVALHLFEDLTSFAGDRPATWLQVFLQRSFALDMLEYVLAHYAVIFRRLSPFAQVLKEQVCSLLMTSLRTSSEIDSVVGEPAFRRLILRSVASVTRLYHSMLTTECEVFMSMLIKSIDLDLPPWHHIMVLETLRGLCVEARMLCLLFKTFDMKLKNTVMVSSIVRTLARIVTRIEPPDASEETLSAVAGMFHCKAKGIECTPEGDPSGMGALIASEAHCITLAVEGLLGVIFTVATMTDEAVGLEELIDSASVQIPNLKPSTKTYDEDTVSVCTALVNSVWRPLLEALSFILTRVQGEAIVSELFKGFQAFTKACGVLYAVEPRDSFLASLCRFTFAFQNDPSRSCIGMTDLPFRAGTASAGGKRPDLIDPREPVVLSYKNIQAMRTLFNVSHQLNLLLGPTSWILVLETLEVLDMVMNSAHSLSQDGISNPARTREPSSELSILTMYDAQMFESTGKMSMPALSFFVTALRQISNTFVGGLASISNSSFSTVSGSAANNVTGQAAMKMWAVERMLSTLMFNVHRLELVWDQVTDHLLELAEHDSQQVRTGVLDALDRAICGILASPQFQENVRRAGAGNDFSDDGNGGPQYVGGNDTKSDNGNSSVSISRQQSNENVALEYTLLQPLSSLYNYGRTTDVRAGALRILLHVLERHAEKLDQSWRSILELLRLVANASEKDLVPLGFQNLRVIMNDGLLTIPAYALELCIEVVGAYVVQKKDVNISLTAIGALWTTADFFARGVNHKFCKAQGLRRTSGHFTAINMPGSLDVERSDIESEVDGEAFESTPDKRLDVDNDALLLAVYGVIQGFITDERPEIRHSAIRTLFQSMSSHGHQLSTTMWEHCIGFLVLPMVETVRILASTSSRDEWRGKELGTEGGKPVHMLIHHSRNTAQKQWDETLVLVLGGTSRLLKSYFKIFLSLNGFEHRWSILLAFIGENIVHGSKEVSLAAIASLNPLLISQATRDNLPPQYFMAAFSMYESIIPRVVQPDSRVVSKAHKDLLQSLVDLYNNGHLLFSTSCYLRLLVLVDLFVWIPGPPGELAAISQVQQTVLAVLPFIKPANDYLSPLWLTFIYQVLSYLPEGNHSKAVLTQAEYLKVEDSNGSLYKFLTSKANGRSPMVSNSNDLIKAEKGLGNGSLTQRLGVAAPERSRTLSPEFSEKMIEVVLELHQACPLPAAATGIPDIVAAFGRCMATRRDSPKDKLWKTAVDAFISVLRRTLICDTADSEHHRAQDNLVASGTVRSRFWKEVADVYDKFMVGACGRAIPLPAGFTIEPEVLDVDERVENMVLCFLTDELLTSCRDAPREVLHHLIGVVDQCAARTSTLPLASVVLLPAHCGRFSLSCLEKLFVLCSCELYFTGESSNVIVSQIAVPILLARCRAILHHFAETEKQAGNSMRPQIIMDEVLVVLKGLANLVLHPLTAMQLGLPVRRSEVTPQQNQHDQELQSRSSSSTFQNVNLEPHLNSERAHLFLLYRNVCELLTTRVLEVRELLQALLMLVGTELGL